MFFAAAVVLLGKASWCCHHFQSMWPYYESHCWNKKLIAKQTADMKCIDLSSIERTRRCRQSRNHHTLRCPNWNLRCGCMHASNGTTACTSEQKTDSVDCGPVQERKTDPAWHLLESLHCETCSIIPGLHGLAYEQIPLRHSSLSLKQRQQQIS